MSQSTQQEEQVRKEQVKKEKEQEQEEEEEEDPTSPHSLTKKTGGKLHLFGYGSLIYKQNFPFEKAIPSFIENYTRVWHQSSIDHRGTKEDPGRVVTILPSSSSSRVHGLTFVIAPEHVDETLEALDIRERCGYDRVAIKTFLHDVNNNNNDPNKKKDDDDLLLLLCPHTLCYIANANNEHYCGGDSIEKMAKQIARCVGPSGKNTEYLFKMCDGLRAINALQFDNETCELEKEVKKILALK